MRMRICLLEIKKLNVHNNHYKSDIFIKYYYAWYLTVLSHFRRYIHDRLIIQEFFGLGEYIKIQAEVNLIHSLLKSAGLHNTTQFFVVPTICQPLAMIQSQIHLSLFILQGHVSQEHILFKMYVCIVMYWHACIHFHFKSPTLFRSCFFNTLNDNNSKSVSTAYLDPLFSPKSYNLQKSSSVLSQGQTLTSTRQI